MSQLIRKHKTWSDVNRETARAWLFRTDAERLAAVTLLAEHHHQPPLDIHARPLPAIYPIVKRRGR